jgi:hypothetical protein
MKYVMVIIHVHIWNKEAFVGMICRRCGNALPWQLPARYLVIDYFSQFCCFVVDDDVEIGVLCVSIVVTYVYSLFYIVIKCGIFLRV